MQQLFCFEYCVLTGFMNFVFPILRLLDIILGTNDIFSRCTPLHLASSSSFIFIESDLQRLLVRSCYCDDPMDLRTSTKDFISTVRTVSCRFLRAQSSESAWRLERKKP